jgi:hypothetical protein
MISKYAPFGPFSTRPNNGFHWAARVIEWAWSALTDFCLGVLLELADWVLASPCPRCECVEGGENLGGAPPLVTFAAGELDQHAGVDQGLQ